MLLDLYQAVWYRRQVAGGGGSHGLAARAAGTSGVLLVCPTSISDVDLSALMLAGVTTAAGSDGVAAGGIDWVSQETNESVATTSAWGQAAATIDRMASGVITSAAGNSEPEVC